MTQLLHHTAFKHDLDPNFVSARARTSEGGTVTISVETDLGLNPSSGVNNPDSFIVKYQRSGINHLAGL